MTTPARACFTVDDGGDLVNLWKMELIMIQPIDRGDDSAPLQDAPKGHTHEVLAVTSRQDSYRLMSGTKEEAESHMTMLKSRLVIW